MPYFKVTTTFIDGRRDSYTREAVDGFAAIDEVFLKYGEEASRVAAINVREEGAARQSLPVVCVEGYKPRGEA